MEGVGKYFLINRVPLQGWSHRHGLQCTWIAGVSFFLLWPGLLGPEALLLSLAALLSPLDRQLEWTLPECDPPSRRCLCPWSPGAHVPPLPVWDGRSHTSLAVCLNLLSTSRQLPWKLWAPGGEKQGRELERKVMGGPGAAFVGSPPGSWAGSEPWAHRAGILLAGVSKEHPPLSLKALRTQNHFVSCHQPLADFFHWPQFCFC